MREHLCNVHQSTLLRNPSSVFSERLEERITILQERNKTQVVTRTSFCTLTWKLFPHVILSPHHLLEINWLILLFTTSSNGIIYLTFLGWQRRYFILENGIFKYGRREDTKKWIPIPLVNAVLLKARGKSTRFVVDSGTLVVHLRAKVCYGSE